MSRKRRTRQRVAQASQVKARGFTVVAEGIRATARPRTSPRPQPHDRGQRAAVSSTPRPGPAIRLVAAHTAVRVAPITPGKRAWWSGVRALLADPYFLGACVITLAAFILRVVGTSVGLPNHYHWDEPTIVNRAMRMGSGDLDPHFFIYPGLSFYVTFISEVGLYIVGHALHAYPTINAYAAAYFTNSTPFYLLGRVLGALVGSVTVLVCYVVGKRFFTPAVGIIAAVLLTVSPVHVANAHFITNDVPMAFFVLLSYVWLWDVYARGRRRDYIYAGITIGLGIATKYLPAVLLVSLILAHAFRVYREAGRWRPRRAELVPVALGIGVAALTFVVASPYSILDWRTAMHDYVAQGQLSSAAGSTAAPLNFLPYLTATLPWSIGWLAYIAALVGLVTVARTRGERQRQLLLLASFPLLFFLIIGAARLPWARYLVTLQPFLALSAAAIVWWGAHEVPNVLKRLAPQVRIRRLGLIYGSLAVLSLVLLAQPALTSMQYDRYLTLEDTRTAAANWFTANVPSGTKIAVQPLFDRYFFTAPIMTESQLATLESDIPSGKPAIRETVDVFYRAHAVYPDVRFVYDVAKLRADGVRFVVLSSADAADAPSPSIEASFISDLEHQAVTVLRFTPPMNLSWADMYPVSMPVITIYELPSHA